MKVKRKKVFFALGALLLIVLVIPVIYPVFNSFAKVTPHTELVARAKSLEIALTSHVDRNGVYPQSLDELVDKKNFPESALTYPDLYVLPEGKWEIPEEHDKLQWIYIPPETTGDDVPVLIAPLPFIYASAPKEPRRLVVFRGRGIREVKESEMPEIWDAVLERRARLHTETTSN